MPGEQELRAALDRVHFRSPRDAWVLVETLRDFAVATKAALGDDIVSVYVNGSLTMGDFEPASSDIDFLVVTSRPLGEGDLSRVTRVHEEIAGKPFGDRLEGSYAAMARLRPWGIEGDLLFTEPGMQPTFGPGDYSADNMWALRHAAVPLVGPMPEAVMPDVDDKTLRAGLRQYLGEIRVRSSGVSDENLPSCLLNMARCMFGIDFGRACTKHEAAHWLLSREPELEPGLTGALQVRSGMAELQSRAEVMRIAVAAVASLSDGFLIDEHWRMGSS